MDNEETLCLPFRDRKEHEVSASYERSARTPEVGVRSVGHTYFAMPLREKTAAEMPNVSQAGESIQGRGENQAEQPLPPLLSSWRPAWFVRAVLLLRCWLDRVQAVSRGGLSCPRRRSGFAAVLGVIAGLLAAMVVLRPTGLLMHRTGLPKQPTGRPAATDDLVASSPAGAVKMEPSVGAAKALTPGLEGAPRLEGAPAKGRSSTVLDTEASIEKAFGMMENGDCRGAARTYRELAAAEAFAREPVSWEVNWENFARNAETGCDKEIF